MKIAESPKHQYYIYPNSITRLSTSVLFTGKTESKRRTEVQLILASCTNMTFLVISSQITQNKKTTYYYYKNPKRLIAYTNSAMFHTLNLLCKGQ